MLKSDLVGGIVLEENVFNNMKGMFCELHKNELRSGVGNGEKVGKSTWLE